MLIAISQLPFLHYLGWSGAQANCDFFYGSHYRPIRRSSQRNEELSLSANWMNTGERFSPVFSRHNGSEVKTIGDGFLVEFVSALEAVRCAFDIQQSLHDLNIPDCPIGKFWSVSAFMSGMSSMRPMTFTGTLLTSHHGSNQWQEPGGICISQPAHAQVRNKFEFPIKSIGVRALKNVDLPMEIFKIVLPWDKQSSEETQIAPKTRIAILPFSNISPDPSDEYFADGMTEELINTISHNHH